jgi:hypothetical protein
VLSGRPEATGLYNEIYIGMSMLSKTSLSAVSDSDIFCLSGEWQNNGQVEWNSVLRLSFLTLITGQVAVRVPRASSKGDDFRDVSSQRLIILGLSDKSCVPALPAGSFSMGNF